MSRFVGFFRLSAPAVFLAAVAITASSAQAPSLKQIMADPDWIGSPVEAAWWQLDGESYVARIKRVNSDIRDLIQVDVDTGASRVVGAEERSALDGDGPIYDAERSRTLNLRAGNAFLRDLRSGSLVQLTASGDAEEVRFGADPKTVLVRLGQNWWRINLDARVLRPLADLRFEKLPDAEPEDSLEQHQLALFQTLARERSRRMEQRAHEVKTFRADATRAPEPWYLGDEMESVLATPSADGRWMLVVVQEAEADEGRQDAMPRYVTESGYVEIEDVRVLVGRQQPNPQLLWLLDLETRTRHELGLSGLSGIDADPLADLKQAQDIDLHDEDDPRPVSIAGIEWHPQKPIAAVQLRAIDNKDRWTVRVDTDTRELAEVHRLTDPAWINWSFNEFGWVPGSESIWLLSEETGYSHLYTVNSEGVVRAVTRGEFELSEVRFGEADNVAWALTNRAHPTEYDLYRISLRNGDMTRLSDLKGVESFALGPQLQHVLIRYSGPYLPTQAAVLPLGEGDPAQPKAVTDTRSEDYRAIDWQPFELVGVPSSHVEKPIWSKFYPARGDFAGPRPAVLFVHGAGYTQNTHYKFPYYFREQMFHNLLTERGYHVLDMDYRASEGYGRDWRTAIYRQMGTPELEDLIDGVDWLVENHDVDPARVGVYGGSYGGFMTFMAMFNAPDTFAAGASLRPVTDWSHYNRFYTSNILNTPEVDPEAYRRSSPIEFVEGLKGALLISHGMLDDNVFYKDSVRLVQRLIELEKENWELASYPLEPHGYVHPESWLDQYRRILDLFESNLNNATLQAQ